MDFESHLLEIPTWVLNADEIQLLRKALEWFESNGMGEATVGLQFRLANELDQVAADITFRGDDLAKRIAATRIAMGVSLDNKKIDEIQWGAMGWISRFGLDWKGPKLQRGLSADHIAGLIALARSPNFDLTEDLRSNLELCKNHLVGKLGDAVKLISSKSNVIVDDDLRQAVLVVTNEVLRLRQLLPVTDNSKLLDLSEVKKLSVHKFFRYFDSIDETQWPQLKDQFQQWLLGMEGTTLKTAEANAKFASGITERETTGF